MIKFFLSIYDAFEHHRGVLYAVLAVLTAVLLAMALNVQLDENISSFFEGGKDEERTDMFKNLKVNDKIVVMLSGEDPDLLVEASDRFVESIQPLVEQGLVDDVEAGVDQNLVARATGFVYDHLPIFLEESDYDTLRVKLSRDGIQRSVDNCYEQIASSAGMFIGEVLLRDPLNIGTHFLRKFESFNTDLDYQIYGGRLFTEDLGTLIMFLEPVFDIGDTGKNELLVSGIETAQRNLSEYDLEFNVIGGPVVAVYNARQIKSDTALTMSIALLIILAVIIVSFRSRWTIPLIILPPVFGALFSLAMLWIIQGTVSAIAIGAGTIVLGISLSYSIHVISHINHTCDPRQIITDLAYPLSVGCFTTIVAFFSLSFTKSPLLRDMGLFSTFTLIGTTLFCLIFLPHFIKGVRNDRPSRVLDLIEKINGHSYEKNVPIVISVFAITVFCLFFYNDVEFDDDMSHINYIPEHVARAEERLNDIYQNKTAQVYVVSGNTAKRDCRSIYNELTSLYDTLSARSLISDYLTISDFVIPEEVQRERIERWNTFWAEKRDNTLAEIKVAAHQSGFRDGAFSLFEQLLNREYVLCTYSPDEIGDVPLLSDWILPVDGSLAFVSRITLDDADKADVYEAIDHVGGSTVMDRAYFSSKMVADSNDDFNFILFVSSAVVFLALLLSYGRIELTLMTFLPMCVSWVIILGFMALLDIKFNIVNIILATFIFGIGDDFSIFIMDGLIQEYKYGRKLFKAHKTAIFFSALTTVVGMGVLIFAKHPALKSIAAISVLGLAVVVFVSYTVQPFLFRLFITSQTDRHHFPYTLGSVLNTIYAFTYFLLGCIVVQLLTWVMVVLPIRKKHKKLAVHYLLYGFTRFFMNTMITVRTKRINKSGEDYRTPAVIIANHQSFIDILLLLSMTPKLIMVTNDWVWKSPFFGHIIRYADFYHAADGYDRLKDRLKEKIEEGYSVVIFPEGTRSPDCRIQRFHKGAFYLAQSLQLDILPVLIYGAGLISSKRQGFYIKSGYAVIKTMERVRFGNGSFGLHYREQTKYFRHWYEDRYAEMENLYSRAYNPYFRKALIKNYIYKGPVLEGYIRIKSRMDHYYNLWDRMAPLKGVITDVGCGYGQLSVMLGILGPERTVVGIDYDPDKIEVASRCFMAHGNIAFRCESMGTADLPESDFFIFNDSLHYVSDEMKISVLEQCVEKLNPGGTIAIREGNDSEESAVAHRQVRRSELWSTRILKFNKTSAPLAFIDDSWMRDFAAAHRLKLKIRRCDSYSSETLYILGRNEMQ